LWSFWVDSESGGKASAVVAKAAKRATRSFIYCWKTVSVGGKKDCVGVLRELESSAVNLYMQLGQGQIYIHTVVRYSATRQRAEERKSRMIWTSGRGRGLEGDGQTCRVR
jgi:hypothetical protein